MILRRGLLDATLPKKRRKPFKMKTHDIWESPSLLIDNAAAEAIAFARGEDFRAILD